MQRLSRLILRLPPLVRTHCHGGAIPNAKLFVTISMRTTYTCRIHFSFVDKHGTVHAASGLEGENLVHAAHEAKVDLEGACECSLACSTCHVILPDTLYDSLGVPSEEEEDLLDLAFGLTPT